MARLVLCVLALCAAGAFSESHEKWAESEIRDLKERQSEILFIYNHIHQPFTDPKYQDIASTWSIENNYGKYKNLTATETYVGILKDNWYLPRDVPFSVGEPTHAFEAMTLFNMLYSAKDYETFYKTVVYLKDIINQGVFVYVLSITIIYRKDTQGITFPPIYEIFPSYFNNGGVMATAQRLNIHGQRFIKYYPSTYAWGENVVISWNATARPYRKSAVAHFTHDYELNAAQYFLSLVTPYWMGGIESPFICKENRGEAWWFTHRQLVARYYMECLSDGHGEIPEITNVVKTGYTSGLLYNNGIPFPKRPYNYHLHQPKLARAIEKVTIYEKRIWEAIDKGFYINRKGKYVSLHTDDGLDILGRLIESNADSPNRHYYKDFIRIWKQILGNSINPGLEYVSHFNPLVVPSALENYQTSLRDPAFYMIWKRILNLFAYWQKRRPQYKPEDLSLPGVSIEKVEVSELVTFYEYVKMNITNSLFQTEAESKGLYKHAKVLVEYPRLNHKPFNVKFAVKSKVAKKVLVKFFLAPKYDSKGFKILLHLNTENFFMLDQFVYDLTVGDNVITRNCTDNILTSKESPSGHELYAKLSKGEWTPTRWSVNVFPHHLLLPKGKICGMKFQLVVYVMEFDGIKPHCSYGYDVSGYPTDRPLHRTQIKNVKNLHIHDVIIYHKKV